MTEEKRENIPPHVRAYYDKGVVAMERDNLDYAISMFEIALSLEPQLLQVRKLLRAASVRRANLNPPSKFSIAKGMVTLVKITSLLKKNPIQALEVSEKLLQIDPFNLKFSKAQCDSAEAAKLPKVAIQTLEILNDNTPPTASVLQSLARLYHQTDQLAREYECRKKILKLNPNNANALKELKDTAAHLTMEKPGWKKS